MAQLSAAHTAATFNVDCIASSSFSGGTLDPLDGIPGVEPTVFRGPDGTRGRANAKHSFLEPGAPVIQSCSPRLVRAAHTLHHHAQRGEVSTVSSVSAILLHHPFTEPSPVLPPPQTHSPRLTSPTSCLQLLLGCQSRVREQGGYSAAEESGPLDRRLPARWGTAVLQGAVGWSFIYLPKRCRCG